ncbi:MAG: DUF4474 domain-containing protein [Clostridia bacterium]|nr:DUF4474 domain-containing protein [Clostridia bacterium]
MKITRKIVAVLMSLVILCTMAMPTLAASEKSMKSVAQYTDMLEDEGYAAITTAEVLEMFKAASDFFRLMTGDRFPSEEKLDISFDKFLTDANLYVLQNSGVDVESILRNLPPLNKFSTLVMEAFEIDPVAFREAMFAIRDKHDAEGTGYGVIYHFLGCYFSIIDKIELFAEPTDDPAVYQVCFNIVFLDGEYVTIHTGMFINTETGEMYNNDGKGMLGLGFNFNFKEMIIYTVVDAWTRNFGFAVLYDIAANVIGIYDYETRRYHFDYDGLEWMIQVWKGTYFYVTNGAEVGIYNRVPGEEMGTFYNCATDDQMMEMQMKLSYKDKVLINTKPQVHWWLTGFNLSGTVYEPASLSMVYSIKFPNTTMLKAFTNAVDMEEHHDTTYTVNGTTVTVNW